MTRCYPFRRGKVNFTGRLLRVAFLVQAEIATDLIGRVIVSQWLTRVTSSAHEPRVNLEYKKALDFPFDALSPSPQRICR